MAQHEKNKRGDAGSSPAPGANLLITKIMVTDDASQITIPKELAISILTQLGAYVKPELENLINQSPQTWEDIKTFEDVFKVKFQSGPNVLPIEVTENEQMILNYNGQEKSMLAVVAFLKLSLISRAMNCLANDGQIWQPDWSNTDEYKFYPWLKYVAGSGFSGRGYGYGRTRTVVGSRLCFKTSELARYAGRQFADQYKRFWLISQ